MFFFFFDSILELVSTTSHDNYVKLVVSSLDYGKEGMARVILAKALTSSSDVSRKSTFPHEEFETMTP